MIFFSSFARDFCAYISGAPRTDYMEATPRFPSCRKVRPFNIRRLFGHNNAESEN